MIFKLIGLFLFWRKNDLLSIVMKCASWAVLTCLLAGIFTGAKTALIAGVAAALVAAGHYALKVRKTNAGLLQMVNGDKEKFAALKDRSKRNGFAGVLVNEMLLAEADEHYPDEDEFEEISDEEKQANLAATQKLVSSVSNLCVASGYAQSRSCKQAEASLLDQFEDGYSVPDVQDIVCAFLPDNYLQIYCRDYTENSQHADLMRSFSQATNGRWDPGQCSSMYDEEADQWNLIYQENGKNKTWKFRQTDGWLSEKFLTALVAYTEKRSGYIVTILGTDEMVDAVCLPAELHYAIIGDARDREVQLAA